MSSLHLLFPRAVRDANRNRFLVAETDPGVWAVVRVGHKGGLSQVVAAKSEHRAHVLAEQFNDMFEEGMIY